MEAPQGAKFAHYKCGSKLYPVTGVIIIVKRLEQVYLEGRYIRNCYYYLFIIISYILHNTFYIKNIYMYIQKNIQSIIQFSLD